MKKSLNIGILGLGQVGCGVYSILRSRAKDLQAKCSTQFNVVQIAVRNKNKKRLVSVDHSKLTTDAKSVVHNPKINVVIELIGGIHPAKELILAALRSGKDVITANKALLAESGHELFEEAFES
jgi:homoserine dehydrogenase